MKATRSALIIDDEKTILSFAEATLVREGMKVLTAANGKAGVDMFRAHKDEVSVILLDLQMPVLGGEQAYPLLKELNPDVPVILSSGFDESEAVRKCSELHPAAFLQKPYPAERLVEVVSEALQRRRGSAE